MKESKTSISEAESYEEIGEFWDTHDLGDYWDETVPVEFEVETRRRPLSERTAIPQSSTFNSCPQPKALEVFYSYSHKDEDYRTELENHLSMLKREGVISGWHDRRISAGQDWNGEIDEHLNSADVILLLVSSDFLASNYCYEKEVKRAVERHQAGEARVIPIIVRPCDWQRAPFARLQALPKDAKAVTRWDDRDEAFLDIARGLRTAAEEISLKSVVKSLLPEVALDSLSTPEIPEILRVSFVARRDREGKDVVARIKDELTPGKNLMMALWGFGGVGKTAIAAEAARGLIDLYKNRVVWISADGLDNFSLSTLLDTVATKLGYPHLRKSAPNLKIEQLRELVKGSPTLIILDNFETIHASDRERCLEWLGKPAPCAVLITTRDRIDDARNIPIDEMRPEEANTLLDELISEVHDTRAFVHLDRDRLLKTAESNPLVLQWIVGQIDLAQDPDEVLDDLQHGEGTAANRVFNRSYELEQLNNGGRAVLLALSLFAPSAARKALAEIGGFAKLSDKKRFRDAVRAVSSLWLVHTAEDGHRLAVNGLTRELTKAKLSSDPRGKTFRSRFVNRFLGFAERHSQHSAENYDALEFEKDNVVAATDVASHDLDVNSVARLAEILAAPPRAMLVVRGYWEDAIRLVELALALAEHNKLELQIAWWKHSIAVLRNMRSEFDAARKLAEESLNIFRKRDDDVGIGVSLHLLGTIAQAKGQLDDAKKLYEESLVRARNAEAMLHIANTLHHLGWLAQERGALEEAERFYEDSLAIKRKHGDLSDVASSLHHLGWLAQDRGSLQIARTFYLEALETNERLGDQYGIASALHQLGTLCFDEGNYKSCEEFLIKSLIILRKLADRHNLAECLESIGKLKHKRGQLMEAEVFLNEALEIAERLNTPFRIASIKYSRALLAEQQNQSNLAARLVREALPTFEKLNSPKAEAARQLLDKIERNAPAT